MIFHFRQMKFDNINTQQKEKQMDFAAIMNIVAVALQFIPSLITDAEGIFGGGTGAQKNQLVTNAIGTMITGALAGAQAAGATNVTNTINTLTPTISKIVSGTVATMNAAGVLPKSTSSTTSSAS